MSLKNWVMLIFLSFLWGGSFFLIEVALKNFHVFQIVFFRVFFASIFIYVYLLYKKINIPLTLSLWGSFFIMGLLNNVIPFSFFTYAQTEISSSLASILNATTPIFTAIVAHMFTKDEKMDFSKVIGLILGWIGIIILLLPKVDYSFKSAQIFGLVAALSYAFAAVYGKRFKKLNPLVVAFGMLFCSSIILFILNFNDILMVKFVVNGSSAAVILLALFSTSLAYIIYFKILASSGATNLALVTFLIPITAITLGVFVLDESLSTNALIGMIIIFISLLVIDGRIVKKLKVKSRVP